MRLIDRVRIEDPQFPPDIPCIVADEIARQLDELPADIDEISFDAESNGIGAPPFDDFFVEAEAVVHHSVGTQMMHHGVLFKVPGTAIRTAWYSRTAGVCVNLQWKPKGGHCQDRRASILYTNSNFGV